MFPLIPTITVVDIKIQSKRQLSCRKEDTRFSEFFRVPNEVKEEIDITYRVSIKSVISEMINMGLKSESTGENNKKVEKMWNYCSDKTRAFPNLNKMDKMIFSVQVVHSW